MNFPHDPIGTSALAFFCKTLNAAAKASQLKPGVNYKVRRTSAGTFLDISPGGGTETKQRMFPFKIFQNEEVFPPDPSSPNTWRTVRVRAGGVYIDDAEGLFIDTDGNSDGVDQPWDDDVFTELADGSEIDQGTVTNFLCALDDITYFWVEIDDSEAPTEAIIHANINPAADGWDQWPKFDARHFLIGYVDTLTNGDDDIADIYQVEFGHIIRPPTKEIEMCDPDTGELVNYDVYCFKHIEPTITMDSTKISLDSTKTTMDQ